MSKLFGLATVVAGLFALALWQQVAAQATRIRDLEQVVRLSDANAEALSTLAATRNRVEIVYRTETRDLNPNAFPETCLRDPELLRAYDAVRRMRANGHGDAP